MEKYERTIVFNGKAFNVSAAPVEHKGSFNYELVDPDGLYGAVSAAEHGHADRIGGRRGIPMDDVPTWHNYHTAEDAMVAGKAMITYLAGKADKHDKTKGNSLDSEVIQGFLQLQAEKAILEQEQ